MDITSGESYVAAALMHVAIGGIAISAVLFALAWLAPYIKAAWDKASGLARVLFLFSAVGTMMYGGAKSGVIKSSFKFATGLVDNGSYTTNSTVYVAWKLSTGLPSSTAVYIESREKSDTNGVFSAIGNTTFGAGSWSGTLSNATNYDFNVWHNYEPPAPVHTNGTWMYKTMKAKYQPDDNSLNAPVIKAKIVGNDGSTVTSISPEKVSLIETVAEEAGITEE